MTRAALVLAFVLAAAAAAHAQDAAPASEPGFVDSALTLANWKFSVAPYIWFVGLHGTAEAGGHSAHIDVNFSDIWDALDVGVLTAAEARNGRFSLVTNLIYMKLSTSADHPVGPGLPVVPPGSFSVRASEELIMWELRPFWEVVSLPLVDAEHRIALDVGPATRFFWMDSHLDVKLRPSVPVGPFQQRFDSHTNFVDWLGAARIRAQLTDDLSVIASGDYGGFDIGSSSHRTYSLAGFANYRLFERWELTGGWRKISVDHGPIDLDIEGPLVGVTYSF